MAIPSLYNPANYGRYSVCFLSPGVSYPPVYTADRGAFGGRLGGIYVTFRKSLCVLHVPTKTEKYVCEIVTKAMLPHTTHQVKVNQNEALA